MKPDTNKSSPRSPHSPRSQFLTGNAIKKALPSASINMSRRLKNCIPCQRQGTSS